MLGKVSVKGLCDPSKIILILPPFLGLFDGRLRRAGRALRIIRLRGDVA